MKQWQKARLGDLTTVISSGATPLGGAQSYNGNGPILFIRSQNVLMNELDVTEAAYISEEVDNQLARTRVRRGDVLLNITGASIGRVALFCMKGIRANVNQHVCVIRPKPELLFGGFLSRYLSSSEIQGHIERVQSGGTRQALTFGQISDFSVPLPPIDEQQRIAAIFDKAESLRAKRSASLKMFAALRQSIFDSIFGRSSGAPVPVTPLQELVASGDSINYGVVQPGDYYPDGVPLIRVGDFSETQVQLSGLKHISPMIEANYRRSRLRGDEILVSCVGSIGTVALAMPEMEGMNIARAVARIPVNREKVNRLYLAEYLRSSFVQQYFKGETRTVAQPTLNIRQLSLTPVALPPMPMQKLFADRITALEKNIERVRISARKLDAMVASLQSSAFRGAL